jgi:pimeloyl-ACP methyl ester carboxylesterase
MAQPSTTASTTPTAVATATPVRDPSPTAPGPATPGRTDTGRDAPATPVGAMAPAPASWPPTVRPWLQVADRDVVVDGVRLAVRDEGAQASGPPVVLVHGTPSHSVMWREVLPMLAAQGRRVIAYDLLGYGASERPLDRDTSVTAQAELLVGLLDALGCDHVDVVGHDIGGAIAQHLAVARPHRLRRVVLADSVSYDSWPSPTWQHLIDEHAGDPDALPLTAFHQILADQLAMTVTEPSRMSGDVLEAYLAPLVSPAGKRSFFAHQVAHYDSRHTRDIAHRLPQVALPVLVLWGGADRWQPVGYAERLAGDLPHAQLCVVAGAGHFVTEDAPDATAQTLADFLDA